MTPTAAWLLFRHLVTDGLSGRGLKGPDLIAAFAAAVAAESYADGYARGYDAGRASTMSPHRRRENEH